MTKETFAAKLKSLREAAGLSREQLATIAGVPSTRVRDLEQAKHGPNWETVEQLARALNVTTEVFRDTPADAETTNIPQASRKIRHQAVALIPVVGVVGAGPASEEEVEALLPVQPEYARFVAYLVRGDSMSDEGIADGSYIVVRPQDHASPGEKVVAWLADSGAVVKRLDAHNRLVSITNGRRMLPLRDGDSIRGVVVAVWQVEPAAE